VVESTVNVAIPLVSASKGPPLTERLRTTFLPRLVTGIALLLVWEFVVRALAPAYVAKPSTVVMAIPRVITDPAFLKATGATLTARVDVNHQDAFNRNANNVDATTHAKDIFGRVAGRTLVNARLGLRLPGDDWEIAVEGRNLTDKVYYSDIFDNRGSTNSVQGAIGEPRTFAVTVKRRF